MSDPVMVDLFVEDRAHEEFLRPLLARVAGEEGINIVVHTRSARGGHGRAIEELELYQTLIEKGAVDAAGPDLLVVGIDGNCTTFAKKAAEIRSATRLPFSDRLVVACPDPHVERWYVADVESFVKVVGSRPKVVKRKCARDHYKQLLAQAVQQGGHPPTLGGVEFAAELVGQMSLYRAGKGDGSFRTFLRDLRIRLRTVGT